MDIFLTIIAVVVIFSILVLIHELGHFVMARRNGIKVLEFGIGYPPRIFTKKIGETIYSINLIPFGGFVRLFGEEADDKEAAKNSRSFTHKSTWIRTKVILGGVFMNFVLAILLLTIGFSFGIEPLLVNEADLFANLSQGNVVAAPGAFVGSIKDKAKGFGLTEGDKIIAIDDKQIVSDSQLKIFEKGQAIKDIDLTVAVAKDGQVKKVHMPLIGSDKFFGISLKPFTEFPRLKIVEVKAGSPTAKAGIKAGDTILQLNNKEVYYPQDLSDNLSQSGQTATYKIFRDGKDFEFKVALNDTRQVVIADVFEGSAAQKAGIIKNDLVVSIDGNAVYSPVQVQDVLHKNPGKEMVYKIVRDGKDVELKAKSGADNVLGIALSSIFSYKNDDLSVYRGTLLTSITEIKKVHYVPWIAFKNAIYETGRLTVLTVQAFGNTLVSIFSKFAVPADIGGPVQIAYYTHTFVQEGFFALLRFTALLSLSLAVINVLPIPGLDGGKFLFILFEVVSGRKPNAKFEGIVHMLGFVFLILLILLVTYSDIAKLL
ncbi:MAG: site-2 protease family protein [Candidatus Gracilibacteria bacterium]